ncbi:glycogen synthase GlgA [Bacillus sp. 2205SS5-2]|uniref:glycogen synthase GlgA n=1 Tax=Bacillus sp. 2205SS5-2 TaxID=3109031 RepID=UPI003004041F
MKVLFTVSECVPFIKSGGLADVAGALPKELLKLGTDIRVILPKYKGIPLQYQEKMKKVAEFEVQVGWRKQYCGIEQLTLDGVIYYFVDNLYYFERDTLYGHYDDGERFSYFTRAVLDSFPYLDFFPDLIHCHDWHTAMIPFLLKVEYIHRQGYHFMRSMFTIHNLQFQGIFPKTVLSDLLRVDQKYFNSDQLEFHGNMNFLKGGLLAADIISTVSPTYRDEILEDYYGEKINGVLHERKSQLVGILNGIDDTIYNPKEDSTIIPYTVDSLDSKMENKRNLQIEFGLPVRDDVPIIAIISRLTKQKGLDLIKAVFHEMMQEDVQFILLGTGEYEFEQFFRQMEAKYHDKVRSHIGFDEVRAHRIYAGSDLFLMPSKFEPCGLGQMIAMKYGVLPLVRETGGLNDTVNSYNDETEEGNGFSFTNFNAHDMLFTYQRALHFYRKPAIWASIVKQAMNKDNSWAQSAYKYNQLYAELISRSESHVF